MKLSSNSLAMLVKDAAGGRHPVLAVAQRMESGQLTVEVAIKVSAIPTEMVLLARGNSS